MKVNEIFYSLQGEGFWTGTPAIFIRLSGCNLQCAFCDTQHEWGTQMSDADIIAAIENYPAHHVVITGGEPSLFLTTKFVDMLHAKGKFIAVETNGTRPLPENVDWITLSPKDAFEQNGTPIISHCNELKVVFDGHEPNDYAHISSEHRFLQPCDVGDERRNREILESTIAYCKAHPQWRLSLQTHKITHIR